MRFVSALCCVVCSLRLGLIVGAMLALGGCDTEEQDSDLAIASNLPCRGDEGCPIGTRCQVPNTTSSQLHLQSTEAIAAPPLVPGCEQPCFDQSLCPVGFACLNTQPESQPPCTACIPGCKHQDCEPGSACEGDTCQPVTPCTSPDFAGCPEFWICDRSSLDAAVPPYAYSNLDDDEYDRTLRAVAAGCRQLTCDEPGAEPCPPYSRCDNTVQRCVSIPCTELMLCPYSDNICRAKRADESSDLFGCVPRTCEEGFACAPGEVCDVANTHPSTRGCRAQSCNEGYTCLTSQICEPGVVGADAHGCRLTRSAMSGAAADPLGVCR
jgi:hypothetical protein